MYLQVMENVVINIECILIALLLQYVIVHCRGEIKILVYSKKAEGYLKCLIDNNNNSPLSNPLPDQSKQYQIYFNK